MTLDRSSPHDGSSIESTVGSINSVDMYIVVLCCVPFGYAPPFTGADGRSGGTRRIYGLEGHSIPRRCVSRVGWWLRLVA